MDIRPPRKPAQRPAGSEAAPEGMLPQPVVDAELTTPSIDPSNPKRPRRRLLVMLACLITAVVAALCAASVAWYSWAISPASEEPTSVRVVVAPGDTSVSIAEVLHEHDLIRSRLAFNLYTQLSGTRSKLQAGGYVLSANQSVATIVEHMTSGKTDELNITILPGMTLAELRERFKQDGFSDDEIDIAFNATYNHPLLATMPAGATLEGYLYPETYRMNADQTLQALFERVFDEMYDTLQEKKYLEEFAKRKLTIHQAVTLASIVQKEVTDPVDQKQVAQVFLRRYSEGIQLGSDVTYMYAAEQTGAKASPSLDSPYNTRKYVGLPPGPISNMNPSALEAVAFPAPGDFLYFVAGDGPDEGKTFFAHTEAEHNANIAAHCRVLCQ